MTEYIHPASDSFLAFDPSRVPSPCFVVDEAAVERNLKVLADFQQRSGAKVLLALKAFGMYSLGPLFNKYLAGTCASGLAEARLGREEFGGEVHVFSAAYKESDLSEIMKIADHVILNSLSQWDRFKALAESAMSARPELQIGLRINPEHSEGALPIYDPCTAGSRLGVPISQLADVDLSMFSGLHFHTLCQQGFAPLDRTLAKIESDFGDRLSQFEWINFGGGHLLTHPDYDIEALIVRIKAFSEKYGLQVYLEPGEGIVNKTGVMVAEILDTMTNVTDIAIIDCSATCHMPDILEMPYRANIFHSGLPGDYEHTYRLGGLSCLAGDVVGDYSFEKPLKVGDRIMFDDMAHYTMVKTSTFNGVQLPSIAIWNSQSDEVRVVKGFTYEDFRDRLS
jgi:carboxynorspermidine decarboxylase